MAFITSIIILEDIPIHIDNLNVTVSLVLSVLTFLMEIIGYFAFFKTVNKCLFLAVIFLVKLEYYNVFR